jgi:hypothetical protein
MARGRSTGGRSVAVGPGHADRRFSRQTKESVMARKKNKQAQKDKKAQKDKAQEAKKPN